MPCFSLWLRLRFLGLFCFAVAITFTSREAVAATTESPSDAGSSSVSSGGSSNNVPFPQGSCVDSDAKCALWASQGECQSNAVWMMSNCRRSCQSCQGGDRAWQLRNQLSKNYEASSNNSTSGFAGRLNATLSRTVRVESVRLVHMEIDEQRQLIRTFGRMVLSWNDSKVVWDKEEWGISWLNFYWIQVWTPQLTQVNAPANQPGTITGKVLAANHTGQVYMWVDFSFLINYHFDYSRYPTDKQRICYKFDDKRYFSVRLKVAEEVKNRRREAISDTHLNGWTVEDLQLADTRYVIQVLGDWKQNPFDVQAANCELCVVLRRNAAYFVSEMLCPALVTSAITLCAVLFQLGNMQFASLSFSLLLQLVAMVVINSRLPAYPNTTPIILKYAGFNFIATALLMALSLALRRLSQANSNIPLPRSVYTLAALIDRWLPLPKGGKETSEEHHAMGCYYEVAFTLNNLIFTLAFIVYTLLMVLCFIF